MREKTWTREQLQHDFPSAGSLKEILQQLNQQVGRHGEVICEVAVNGMPLDEEKEALFAANALDEITSVSVKTQNPQSLLDESLVSCCDYVGKLLIALEHSAQLFRTDSLHEAHIYYKGCIEGSQWFIEMITHYKTAYQSLRGKLSASWLELEQAMILVLEQIFDAYKEKNYILVADLLEYDLITIFNRWQQELSQSGNRNGEPRHAQSPPPISTSSGPLR